MDDDQLKDHWHAEQLKIASAVEIIADESRRDQGLKHLTFSSKQNDSIAVGGVDVSFGDNDLAVAVYVVTKGEEVIYQDSITYTLDVPYISSYLAFREIEPLTTLVMKQKENQPTMTPEVILVDGNGIFHERRAGIACFLGVRTNMRTIGVAKTLYCMDGLNHKVVSESLEEKLDTFVRTIESDVDSKLDIRVKSQMDEGVAFFIDSAIQPISEDRRIQSLVNTIETNVRTISKYCDGFSVPIMDKNGSVLAAALLAHGAKIGQRSSAGKAKGKGGTKIPIFVSIGHKISLEEALRVCVSTSYARIPESVRRADLIGREIIRSIRRQHQGDNPNG